MPETMAVPDVGRKKTPDAERRDDIAVKMDRTLADKARLVASRNGVTLAAYLTELLRKPVEKDFARTIKEMGVGE